MAGSFLELVREITKTGQLACLYFDGDEIGATSEPEGIRIDRVVGFYNAESQDEDIVDDVNGYINESRSSKIKTGFVEIDQELRPVFDELYFQICSTITRNGRNKNKVKAVRSLAKGNFVVYPDSYKKYDKLSDEVLYATVGEYSGYPAPGIDQVAIDFMAVINATRQA